MAHVQSKRVWLAGSAALAVLIALAGWFAVISPQLSSASSLQSQTGTAQDQNLTLQSNVAKLRRETDNLSALTASLRGLVAALPFDSGLPAFTRQLSTQAAQRRVSLTSITVGAIAPLSKTGAGTTGQSATTSAAGKMFAIPITLSSVGSAANQLAFLKAIQVDGPRRALVTSSQLAPGAQSQSTSVNASCTMTTQLTIFTAPLTPVELAQLEKLLNGAIPTN